MYLAHKIYLSRVDHRVSLWSGRRMTGGEIKVWLTSLSKQKFCPTVCLRNRGIPGTQPLHYIWCHILLNSHLMTILMTLLFVKPLLHGMHCHNSSVVSCLIPYSSIRQLLSFPCFWIGLIRCSVYTLPKVTCEWKVDTWFYSRNWHERPTFPVIASRSHLIKCKFLSIE